MSDQIAGLESALLARAQKLAEEYLANGRHAQRQIVDDTNEHLRVEEEREVLSAKAHAERAYQRLVQAAELGLRADFDRVQWNLINAVLDSLPARLAEQSEDEPRYVPLLAAWTREGAQAIEREELMVQVNARDLARLRRDWERHAHDAAPEKRLALSEQGIDCIGGVLISSRDGDIRFDNTFEGRMERLREALQRAVAEHLFPNGEARVG